MNRPTGKGGWRLDFFFIFSSGGHVVYRSGTILPILVGSHIPVKFESHWQKGLGGDII